MVGLYDFFVFKCPSERNKKWQLHMNTLYYVPSSLLLSLKVLLFCTSASHCACDWIDWPLVIWLASCGLASFKWIGSPLTDRLTSSGLTRLASL